MSLIESANPQSSPPFTRRAWSSWDSFHSWSLFRRRTRPWFPPPPSSSRHPRASRQPPPEEQRSRRGKAAAVTGLRSGDHRAGKGVSARSNSARGSSSQRAREGSNRQHAGLSVNPTLFSSSSSSSTYTGMISGAGSALQRRAQGRGSETADLSSTSHHPRPGSTIAHHQHHHFHRHDHHHHHYHHHHYYHLPQRLWRDLEQGTVASSQESSNGTFIDTEPPPRLSTDITSGSNSQVMYDPREAAMAARDRLDERLRAAALMTDRHRNVGTSGSFTDEFGLFDEDDESWIEEEVWETGMRDWLAAWEFEERWHLDMFPPSEHLSRPVGLSRSEIAYLPREEFTSKSTRTAKESDNCRLGMSDQVDCPVCLEPFLPGQILLCLPCKHRFHPDCLTPWLESHEQCPYCRAKISFEGTGEDGSSGGSDSITVVPQEEEDLLTWIATMDAGFSRLNFHST